MKFSADYALMTCNSSSLFLVIVKMLSILPECFWVLISVLKAVLHEILMAYAYCEYTYSRLFCQGYRVIDISISRPYYVERTGS